MSSHHYFADIGAWPRSVRHMNATYAIGFIGSLILTFCAYLLTVHHLLRPVVLIPVLMVLACFQFCVQVLNFLHVSGEPFSRERMIALVSTGIVMFILVLGSMWIMSNLDARMMPDSAQMETYMQRQQGI